MLIRTRASTAPWWLTAAYVTALVPADYVMASSMLRGLDRRSTLGCRPLVVRSRGMARCCVGLCRRRRGDLLRPARRQRRAATHLLELGAGGDLLGEQRRLDAVEQTLQPADQLGLRDAQLGLARGRCHR